MIPESSMLRPRQVGYLDPIASAGTHSCWPAKARQGRGDWLPRTGAVGSRAETTPAGSDYLKRVLEGDERGGMTTIQAGHMVPLPFGSFSDSETGRVRIRLVNVESSSYRVARECMIRLDREDLEDPGKLRP